MLAKLKRQSMPASNEQDLVFRVIHGHGHKSSVMSQQTSSSSSDESVDADEAIEIEPIVAEDRKVRTNLLELSLLNLRLIYLRPLIAS